VPRRARDDERGDVRIAAQGFWGNATTNKLDVVSQRVIDKALAGKAVYIPGKAQPLPRVFGQSRAARAGDGRRVPAVQRRAGKVAGNGEGKPA
jgi:hypothetical protein